MKPMIVVAGIEREMTEKEFEIYLADQARAEAEATTKAQAEAARAALLAKLGITEEEAKLLLGGN